MNRRLIRNYFLNGKRAEGPTVADQTNFRVERSAAVSDRDLGDRARDLKDWPRSILLYRRYLEQHADDAAIWVQLGHALKESGLIFEARRAYSNAVVIDPQSSDTQLQLGHARKLQGLRYEAAICYALAAKLDPASPAVRELEELGPDILDRPAESGDRPGVPPTDADVAAQRDLLLARHDLLPQFVAFFDTEFYSSKQKLGQDFFDADNLKALTHFCEIGIANCAPIAEDLVFDSDFYVETYNHAFRMTDPDNYRYWLNFGLPHGHAPNFSFWLRNTQALGLPDLGGIDLVHCRASKPALSSLKATELVEFLLDGGLVDDDIAIAMTRETADVFVAAARRATRKGDPNLAIQLLQRVVAHVPDAFVAQSDYADRLLDLDLWVAASTIYERLIEVGRGTLWTHHCLTRCYAAQGLLRASYDAIGRGIAAFPQHDILRRDRIAALDRYYGGSTASYHAEARLGRIEAGQAVLEDYCRTVAANGDARRPAPRPIRSVALFASLDLPQCRLYRVEQKVEQLESAGYKVGLFDASRDLAGFLAEVHLFEAVIFYRVALLPSVLPAIQAARASSLVTFCEIDDLIFSARDYPDRLETYGGQISQDTYRMLAMGVPLFAGAMAMCDYAIASTPALAREMTPRVAGRRAFVHRNAFGTDHERYLAYAPTAARDRPVTLFYGSGTMAHKEDFRDVLEPALIAVAKRHGPEKVGLVLIGWLTISPALKLAFPNLVVIEPVFDVHHYWSVLRATDINLAVLKPSLAVDCKSEIKWMEAALFGIPSIVSRTATYADVVADGETGFLCDTVEDWVRALDRLITNPHLRRTMGERAQQVVRRQYRIDAMAQNIRGILEAVSPPQPPVPPQRVLLVNVFYTPQTIGGATRVMHDNILKLQETYGEEFEFEVFTCVDGKLTDYIVEGYVQDGIRVTGVSRSAAAETAEVATNPEMEEIFRRCLERRRPDLIHFHCIQRMSVGIVSVALEMRIPYVVTVHDAWWISDHQFVVDEAGREQTYDYGDPIGVLARHGQKTFARMSALRPALFGAAAVLGVSQAFSDLHVRCGVPNVRTVANGLPPIPPRPRTLAPDGRIRLGFVGGLARHKGFLLLKWALGSEPFHNLSLLLIDHLQSRDHERRETWGTVPVRVTGKFDPDDVADLYGQIDVLVAPSTWPESFGLATREARACGCWVIASDRGDIGGDVVDGVNGHIVDVSSIDGLVAVFRRIEADPERYRHSPPDAGPMRTADDQAHELAVLYRELRSPPGSGAPA